MHEEIKDLTDVLPGSLREQVYSYVNSVAAVADDIFADAKIERSDDLMRELVLLATLRKLFGIIGSSYWAVSNALSATKSTGVDRGGFEIRIGRSRYAKGTREYDGLEALFRQLEKTLIDEQILELVKGGSYAEAIATIHGRRES